MSASRELLNEGYGLKVCNACGTLNHLECIKCANCSWQGDFDFEPERIFDILAQIQHYVNGVVDRELRSVPWGNAISVQIKSVVFTVHRPTDVQ